MEKLLAGYHPSLITDFVFYQHRTYTCEIKAGDTLSSRHVSSRHVRWHTHTYRHVTLSHVCFWRQAVGRDTIPVVSVSV